MASPLPNSKTQNPEKNLTSILSDLIRGQDSALQLNKILSEIKGLNQEEKDLMVEVLNTFTKVISVLDTPTETSEVSNGKRKFDDDSDQKIARRKRARPESCQKILSNKIEDGQAWRKYGQKIILNSKNPRSYFRCTHKYDQGCKAQKRVQTSDEDPNIFIISYIDKHTCKNPFSFMQPSSSLNNSCLISFESNTALNNTFNNINNQEGLMSPSFQSSKQEGGEEAEVLSNVTEPNPTVARISKQVNPTGLNANSDMDRFDQSFDGLEELLNLSDLGSFGFGLL